MNGGFCILNSGLSKQVKLTTLKKKHPHLLESEYQKLKNR